MVALYTLVTAACNAMAEGPYAFITEGLLSSDVVTPMLVRNSSFRPTVALD